VSSADPYSARYAAALCRYVSSRDEAALNAAYELGRAAVRQNLTVLDLAAAQHDALFGLLEDGKTAPVSAVGAAGEFFLEALSAFEVVQRVLHESRETAAAARRQAAVLRQLSTFLGDTSIALDASTSLAEMLQLVTEHAREVTGAERCHARLTLDDGRTQLEADAQDSEEAGVGGDRLAAALTALDGRDLGFVEVFGKQDGKFGELDEAVLGQLAQMASAAVERTLLYRQSTS
jgi:hypothetical protein